MCATLERLEQQLDYISRDVSAAGYRIPVSRQKAHLSAAIRDHRKRCPTCIQELGMAKEGIRQVTP